MAKILKRNHLYKKEVPAAILFFLSAFFAPFFLLLLENLVGSDILLEEIFKLAAVLIFSFFIFNRNTFLISSVFFGLFFSWSEDFLYLNNFFLSGLTSQFWERFFLTSFLHAGTAFVAAAVIYRKKYLFPIALAVNILLHYIFNNSV